MIKTIKKWWGRLTKPDEVTYSSTYVTNQTTGKKALLVAEGTKSASELIDELLAEVEALTAAIEANKVRKPHLWPYKE